MFWDGHNLDTNPYCALCITLFSDDMWQAEDRVASVAEASTQAAQCSSAVARPSSEGRGPQTHLPGSWPSNGILAWNPDWVVHAPWCFLCIVVQVVPCMHPAFCGWPYSAQGGLVSCSGGRTILATHEVMPGVASDRRKRRRVIIRQTCIAHWF